MKNNNLAKEWQGVLIDQQDFLRNTIETFLQNFLNEEFKKFIGAEDYERTTERKGYRNGSYERQLKTRVGTLNINVCRDRAGEFKTELFERYQRSEKALVLGITEMYLCGVSTRRVKEITEELCGFSLSKSQVSVLAKGLDEELEEWRKRELKEEYKYLLCDARYEKIREGGRVESKAFVVIVGVTEKGSREIVGCYMINSESKEEWESCFMDLKERGLRGVEYVVSDDNKGLRRGIEKYFQGVSWQRCQVHYMRNFSSHFGKSQRKEAISLLKDIFESKTKEEALEKKGKMIDYLLKKKDERLVDWFERSIEETLSVLELPESCRKKMKTTNMVERLNQELKRRSKVIRIFPNKESCLRLLTALCQEISEGWGDRKYLSIEKE